MSVSLEMLQAMMQRMLDRLGLVHEDVRDIKNRVTSLETHVAGLHADFAGQSGWIDRVERQLERIERRLDLTDA
jgi:hypothetical protein